MHTCSTSAPAVVCRSLWPTMLFACLLRCMRRSTTDRSHCCRSQWQLLHCVRLHGTWLSRSEGLAHCALAAMRSIALHPHSLTSLFVTSSRSIHSSPLPSTPFRLVIKRIAFLQFPIHRTYTSSPSPLQSPHVRHWRRSPSAAMASPGTDLTEAMVKSKSGSFDLEAIFTLNLSKLSANTHASRRRRLLLLRARHTSTAKARI